MESKNCILVTGVTGFLGKVVLEHLVRQCELLNCRKIFLLIRERNDTDGNQRFKEAVVSSACFSRLPPSWVDLVEVVTGELMKSDLGLLPSLSQKIQTEVTHIIHCAGCVKFNQPLAEATEANVSTVLNIIEFARKCTHLQRLVSTSTAYVTPHHLSPMHEVLAPLPYDASQLYQYILEGKISETEILSETKHPNTYTLSKCLAEHMLVARSGSVPLTIVRPSIISASWRLPFPGWIDSFSAFAGFLAAYGNGLLCVIDADSQTILDIVPVDEVANQLLRAAFEEMTSTSLQIRLATASLCNGLPINMICTKSIQHFVHHRAASFRTPKLHYLGSRGILFRIYDTFYQQLPLFVASTFYALSQNRAMRRRLERMRSSLTGLNRDFPYFTHHSFNFRPSSPLPDEFDPEEYLETTLNGIRKHLLQPKPTTEKKQQPSESLNVEISSPNHFLGTKVKFQMGSFALLVGTLSVACMWRFGSQI